MKKTNFLLVLVIASLSLVSIDCFAQKDTLKINRFGVDQKMLIGKNKKFVLENFSIESPTDSIHFETISVHFPIYKTTDLLMENVNLFIAEGDSLQNFFSVWRSKSMPQTFGSSGFDYFLPAHERKKFSVLLEMDVLLPHLLNVTILLSGVDSRGQQVQVVVTSHDVKFL